MESLAHQAKTILRPLLIAAAVVIVLSALRAGAAVVNPLLLALVIALLCNPIYRWLQRRGMPSWLALLLMVSGVLGGAAVMITVIGVSISRLTAELATYQTLLTAQERQLRDWLTSQGIAASDLQFFGLLNSVNLTRIIGVMLTAIGNVLGNSLLVIVLVLFFLAEMPSFQQRLRDNLGEQNPLLERLQRFGGSVVSYFGIRTYINLVVAIGGLISMVFLDVPFAALWAVIIFVLSYIPYIGIPIALIPTTLLTLAEHGFVRAGLVVLLVSGFNLMIENLVAPSLIGRRLSLSPAVVFVSFFFWTWLLGPPGTFLSMPITVLLTVVLDNYDETRWLARLMGASTIEGLRSRNTTPHASPEAPLPEPEP